MRKRRWLIGGLLIAVLFVVLALRWTRQTDPPTLPHIPVKVQSATPAEHTLYASFLGRVGGTTPWSGAFESGGRIETLHVAEGQAVTAGDRLVSLDPADLMDQQAAAEADYRAAQAAYENALAGTRSESLRQAKAQMEKAEAAFSKAVEDEQHMATLFQAGAVSREQWRQSVLGKEAAHGDLDSARAAYDQALAGASGQDIEAARQQMLAAKSRRDLLAKQVEKGTLTAPVSGIITLIRGQVGEVIGPGVPLVTIDTQQAVVEIALTGEQIERFEPGTPAFVEGEKVGTLTRVLSVPDPAHGLYTGEIELERATDPLGKVLRLEMPRGVVQGVLLPATALVDRGTSGVFTVVDGKARFVPVEVYHYKSESVIVAGLSEGTAVVVENMTRLRERDRVEVIGP